MNSSEDFRDDAAEFQPSAGGCWVGWSDLAVALIAAFEIGYIGADQVYF